MSETENETPTRTWWLDEGEIAPTIVKIEKITARATKRGFDSLYTYGPTGEVHHEPVYEDPMDSRSKILYYETKVEFQVTGTAPKLAGWPFLATLTWEGDVLVTRCLPGYEGRVHAEKITPHFCDHCKVDRYRNDTYLVEDESGTQLQVGSSCVKDFLGHSFQPSWIRHGSDLDEIAE